MKLFSRTNYTLDNLKQFSDSYTVKRHLLNVAVIDDEDFPYLQVLRQHDFRVTKFDDIQSVDQLSNFEIILCDIRGVGKSFGSKYGGGHLIEEISKKSPHKYLIAHSGSTFKTDFNKFFRLCDESVMKGVDVNEMVNLLDRAAKAVNDPIYQWKKTRTALENNKVASDQISKFEQYYISSIVKRKSRKLEKEINKFSRKPISNETANRMLSSLALFSASLVSNLTNN